MEETVATGMESILATSETITTLVGNVFTLMTGNPVLTLMLGASLIGVGVAVYKRIKKAAK